jgi:glutathione S-transferase
MLTVIKALIAQHMLKNPGSTKHFQELVKRTIGTINRALEGKQYLVGGKVSLADLSFIPWDLSLDVILAGDSEASTAPERAKIWPNWHAWHTTLLERPAVKKMLTIQKRVQGKE